MSWLTSSVTGKLSQIGGQLKDILTESTEDIIDPLNELKVVKDRLKEKEHHIEMLKIETTRWQEESNELALKCRTYEAQIEQKQLEFKQIIQQKDAQISELQKRTQLSSSSNLIDSGNFQRSALMEEFEEIVPQSEFSEYLNLQKELKKQNENNLYLINENKQLTIRIKQFEEINSSSLNFDQTQREMENTIANLKKEIYTLSVSNDKQQEEMQAIQNNYTERIRSQSAEIENLKTQLNIKDATSKTSSNKSDDGWCLNGDEINLDLIEKSDLRQIESPVVIDTNETNKNEEIIQLKKQIELLETELEQANNSIQKLRLSPKSATKLASPNVTTSTTQTTTYHERNLQHKNEIDSLNSIIENLQKEAEQANERIQNILNETKLNESSLVKTNQDQEKQIDSLHLELKQLQQSLNQEKMNQFQLAKQDEKEKTETSELKLKINEKMNEITLLNKQVNDLQDANAQFSADLNNSNLKISNLQTDIDRLNEQRKQFEFVLEEKSRESSQLKSDVQKHLQHIGAQSKAIEKLQFELKDLSSKSTESQENQSETSEEIAFFKQQYNQIYSYLEQKNQESLSYYNEIQRLNQIVSDLNKELQDAKTENDNLTEQYEYLVKEFNIEQKMVDELNMHIVDLNQQTFELNNTLITRETKLDEQNQEQPQQIPDHENLMPQYFDKETIKKEIEEDLVKEHQLRLAEIEEKNQQIIEQMQFQIKQLIEEKENLFKEYSDKINQLNYNLNEQHQQIIDQMQYQINQLRQDKEFILNKENNKINELNTIIANYEQQFKSINENSSKETNRNQQMSKELERLREHLVVMSDSYNKEAIQAEEREKQLRLALTEAEKRLEQFDENIDSSSKELEQKIESLNQTNQELKNERDKLKATFKKTEESLNHQIKVTKNLELVLERLQNEKDSQTTIEISKYQQTLKENANQIKNLQKDIICYQDEINSLKELLDSASLLELELNKKDDIIKQLNAQSGTKDALIESLDKRVNEIQKVNESYIEKEIIKNLIIGYIKVNQVQERKQVLKLISTMLNFSQNEMDQVENTSGESKWFGLVKASPNKVVQNKAIDNNKSFTELLIQYVDRESKARPNFTFDLDSTSSTNKKTDSPEKSIVNSASTSSLLSNQNSASAVRFFNNSLISPTNDLNLVNRSQTPNMELVNPTRTDSPGNTFLEQILKNN